MLLRRALFIGPVGAVAGAIAWYFSTESGLLAAAATATLLAAVTTLAGIAAGVLAGAPAKSGMVDRVTVAEGYEAALGATKYGSLTGKAKPSLDKFVDRVRHVNTAWSNLKSLIEKDTSGRLKAAIDAGADDVQSTAEQHEVLCDINALNDVRDALEKRLGRREVRRKEEVARRRRDRGDQIVPHEQRLALRVEVEQPHRVAPQRREHRLGAGAVAIAPAHHVPLPRRVAVEVHQHRRVQQRRPRVGGHVESFVVGRRERRRVLDDAQRRGEYVVVVHAPSKPADAASEALPPAARQALELLVKELPLKQAVSLAAALTHAPRNALYDAALALKASKASP